MTMSLAWLDALCHALEISPIMLFISNEQYSHALRLQSFRNEVADMEASVRAFAKMLAASLRQADSLTEPS